MILEKRREFVTYIYVSCLHCGKKQRYHIAAGFPEESVQLLRKKGAVLIVCDSCAKRGNDERLHSA
jgi:hypothetical protein